jgi:hypothetical protein
VKRSGRDESVWVVIHMCMGTILGISLYSYPYLKLAKTLCISYYCLCLFFDNIGKKGKTGSAWKQWGWRMREGAGDAVGRNGPNNVCTDE